MNGKFHESNKRFISVNKETQNKRGIIPVFVFIDAICGWIRSEFKDEWRYCVEKR